MGWLDKEEMVEKGWWDAQMVKEVEDYETLYASNPTTWSTYYGGKLPQWMCYPAVKNARVPWREFNFNGYSVASCPLCPLPPD